MNALDVLDALQAKVQELADYNKRLQMLSPTDDFRFGEHVAFVSVNDIIEKMRRELLDADA